MNVAAITVRRPSFEWPTDLPVLPIADDPARSCELVGLSFTLPYLEPYLIRTMKEARPKITDEKLQADLARFNAQEGQHYQQHARFNELVRARGYPKLEALEKELSDDYHRFTREKSLRFNLAYAEGFEAFTTASARFSFEEGLDDLEAGLRNAAAEQESLRSLNTSPPRIVYRDRPAVLLTLDGEPIQVTPVRPAGFE